MSVTSSAVSTTSATTSCCSRGRSRRPARRRSFSGQVTQPWRRRGTAPDPSLRCSHGWKEVNDAPARLTIDPSCKDEARVGRQGTLTRVWARRGTRPRAPRDRRYARAYLFGAVCPERAVGAALVLPYADAAATGLHLAEIGRHVAPGAHGVVVLDGAGWHAAGGLAVPGNLTSCRCRAT